MSDSLCGREWKCVLSGTVEEGPVVHRGVPVRMVVTLELRNFPEISVRFFCIVVLWTGYCSFRFWYDTKRARESRIIYVYIKLTNCLSGWIVDAERMMVTTAIAPPITLHMVRKLDCKVLEFIFREREEFERERERQRERREVERERERARRKRTCNFAAV